MIALDYRTNNSRWGLSGIKYDSWEGFAFALGYLANRTHYKNSMYCGIVDLHIERNEKQGAWDKEGRIHYYGSSAYLKSTFPDWYNCKSAGVSNITCRINSNPYMYSLINDFDFEVRTYKGYTTADIFPPTGNAHDNVWNILEDHLRHRELLDDEDIDHIQKSYEAGWNE